MKIIFSSNNTWGVYNFRKNLLSSLKQKGYEIIVVSPKDTTYTNKLSSLGFKIIPVDIDNSSLGVISNLKYFIELYKIYKTTKPDIVLHNAIKPNIYGAIVCRLLKIPVINNISGLGTVFLRNDISSWFGKLLYKISHKKVNIVFFQNPSDKNFFISNRIVTNKQSVLIPGSGVDLSRFYPGYKAKNHNKIKFCFVGRLIRDKGILEYIDAVKFIKSKYSNCEFYILGELYEQNPSAIKKEILESWVSQNLVIYLGKSDSVENEYSKFDCIVLPSYREGLSRVLLEASAMGIPSITSNVPGCKDVIEDNKNGFLCNVKDSQSLIEKIEKFISLPMNDRQKMGEYARKKVEDKFDEKTVIDAYIKAVNEIKYKS